MTITYSRNNQYKKYKQFDHLEPFQFYSSFKQPSLEETGKK